MELSVDLYDVYVSVVNILSKHVVHMAVSDGRGAALLPTHVQEVF